MHNLIGPLLVVVLLFNLFLLGTSRLQAVVNASAGQGVMLGILTLCVHEGFSTWMVLITIGTILVKGVLIPGMLLRAIRDAAIRREIEPFIGRSEEHTSELQSPC